MNNREEHGSIVEQSEDKMPISNTENVTANHIIAFNMEKKLLSTINELDRRYKEELSLYSEKLQRYNVEIEKLKNKIILQEKKVAEAERELISDETLIEYESKNFEKLHNEFNNQLSLLNELADEYKSILSKVEYTKKITSKKRTLLNILEEISEKESLLLNKELERLNHFSQYKEQKKLFEELQSKLQELELDKSYFESTELQKITPLNGSNLSSETVEALPSVVDAEVVES